MDQAPQVPIPPTALPTKTKINFGMLVKSGAFGLIAGLLLAMFFLGWSVKAFYIVWVGITLFFMIIGAMSKKGLEQNASNMNLQGLTSSEKKLAWIFCTLNPVITGAVMYFLWRKTFPLKAKQANEISFIMFFVWIVFGMGLSLLKQS